MLQLNYTEAGLHLERVTSRLEETIARRVILALRLGQTLSVQPCRASLLLPADAPELAHLEIVLRHGSSMAPVDDQFVEVSFSGSWLTETLGTEEGVFLTELGDRAEFWLHRLWQQSQAQISSLAQ